MKRIIWACVSSVVLTLLSSFLVYDILRSKKNKKIDKFEFIEMLKSMKNGVTSNVTNTKEYIGNLYIVGREKIVKKPDNVTYVTLEENEEIIQVA